MGKLTAYPIKLVAKAEKANPWTADKAEGLTERRREIGSDVEEGVLGAERPKTMKFQNRTMSKGTAPPKRMTLRASERVLPAILQMKGVMTWKPKVRTVTGIAGKIEERRQEALPSEANKLGLETEKPMPTRAVIEKSMMKHRKRFAASIALKGKNIMSGAMTRGNAALAITGFKKGNHCETKEPIPETQATNKAKLKQA